MLKVNNNEVNNVIFNGNELKKVIYDGTTVFEKEEEFDYEINISGNALTGVAFYNYNGNKCLVTLVFPKEINYIKNNSNVKEEDWIIEKCKVKMTRTETYGGSSDGTTIVDGSAATKEFTKNVSQTTYKGCYSFIPGYEDIINVYVTVVFLTLVDKIKTVYPPKAGRTDFNNIDNGTPNLYTGIDDQGDTYYFSGDGSSMNNWVSFAGKKWRIIRINGNGSVRLLYAGSGGEDGYIGSAQAYNVQSNHPGYVGWKYSLGSSLEAIRGNDNKSDIYSTVENWYNALSSTDKSYIDSDAIYYNDRELASGNSFSVNSKFNYITHSRLNSNKNPSFICDIISDRFSGANGDIPVGLMTADEVAYAGGVYGTNNFSTYYYLNENGESATGSNDWWTMSPYNASSNGTSRVFIIKDAGLDYSYVHSSGVVRPVISLKSNVVVTGGDGSGNNPYTVALSG